MYEFTTEMTNVVKTKSSVHFSPKKSLSTTITYSGKTQNIIKNTTATEKEELKLKNKIHIIKF